MNHLQRGGRALHVQTDLIVGDSTSVRTTVWERGVVLALVANDLPQQAHDVTDVEAIIVSVESQHQSVLTKLCNGKYD